MAQPFPAATIRTQVLVPLRFADGYATAARAFTFDGLVDGQEHLAFGLGNRAAPVTSAQAAQVPLVRPHSECLTAVRGLRLARHFTINRSPWSTVTASCPALACARRRRA
jgi:hypothetical protein